MIDINNYRKILIISDFSSLKFTKTLFNNFKSFLDNDYFFNENTKFDANELLNNINSLCIINIFDYKLVNRKVLYQHDLILKIESNKIKKYKDRYNLNVNNIINMIRTYKLNKIIT